MCACVVSGGFSLCSGTPETRKAARKNHTCYTRPQLNLGNYMNSIKGILVEHTGTGVIYEHGMGHTKSPCRAASVGDVSEGQCREIGLRHALSMAPRLAAYLVYFSTALEGRVHLDPPPAQIVVLFLSMIMSDTMSELKLCYLCPEISNEFGFIYLRRCPCNICRKKTTELR